LQNPCQELDPSLKNWPTWLLGFSGSVLKEKLLPKKEEKFSEGSEKSTGICCAKDR